MPLISPLMPVPQESRLVKEKPIVEVMVVVCVVCSLCDSHSGFVIVGFS